jgi:two-component system phosphate regulon sensor histidine kinase PhoR
MFHSIRWRIALPYLLLILVTMFALGVYLSNFLYQTTLNEIEGELKAEARLVGDSLSSRLPQQTNENIDALAQHWADLLDARVTIIAADGRVLGESNQNLAKTNNQADRPEIIQALTQGEAVSTRKSETTGSPTIYAAVRLGGVGQPVGVVRVALPLEQVQQSVAGLQRTLAAITLIAGLLAMLLATWIAGHTTRPIRELTRAAGRLWSGQLEGRIIPSTRDEVGQLTQAFNLMAVQLKAQIEALETERSKLASVLAEMTDGVTIVDPQGLVQLLNPAAETMFSVSQAEALGRPVIEVLRNHQIQELWQRCLETGEAQTASLELTTRRLYLQSVATPLGQAMPGSVLLLFQNLTLLRRLETVRRDFISNISHELRTPLASLKALTETLQEGALDDPPAAHRFLQRMETEVDALSLMVSELLELSRIESGRVPLQLKPTLPAELVDVAVDRLRLQAERSNLRLVVECQLDLPPVLADPSRLEQVLVNLLHNAIKFTPAGGEIMVQVEERDNRILFSVRDTGIGIPATDMPRIFERFFKADRARSSGGTGLGLAIARHTVEAHGGEIWAESVEGQGSTFSFSIPLAP